MNKLTYAAVAAAGMISAAASAQTVSNTSLQNINGAYGAGVATTTTTPTGTRTTVVGPAGGANRASGTTVVNQWFQSNVGGGASVGITTDHPHNGTGSVSFQTTSDASKADLQYYFPSLSSLSTLTGISYDFYRSGSSTVDANLAPVMRIDIAKDGVAAGSLVFENVYQQQQATPLNTWTTLTGNLNSGIFWATNAALGPTFASANGGQKTLQAWIDGNAGSTLSVYGLSIGVGSGWAGTFDGAIDNVSLAFSGGRTVTSNFEVPAAAAAVPEPATWGLMILGFGMVGYAMRRRSASVSVARA